MSDLPKLAVTREQAGYIVEDIALGHFTLHLLERPTMPCRLFDPCQSMRCADCCGDGREAIPEGTRVEVGWWRLWSFDFEAMRPVSRWMPVAFATLASVELHDCDVEPWTYRVTLTEVEAPDA